MIEFVVFPFLWWVLSTSVWLILCINSGTPLSDAFFASFVYGVIALITCSPFILIKILEGIQSSASKGIEK